MFGRVTAWRGSEQVNLGPMRQRALFAVLALAGQRPVSRDELVAALWGESPPVQVANVIHTYVKNLRRALEPDRVARQAGVVLRRDGDGYRLNVDPGRVDVLHFRELLAASAAARRAGDDRRVVGQVRMALELSAAPLLADIPLLAGYPPIAEINDDRSRCATWLAEAALRCRIPAEALTAIEQAGAARPLDEEVHAWLLRIYYAVGRRADALMAFERLRRRLDEELGVDPAPGLQSLHVAVLRDDPVLEVARQPENKATESRPATAGTARYLPRDLPDFTGRQQVLQQLLDAVPAVDAKPATAPVVLAINGMPGIGKTTFATRLAHLVADRYADAQLFVDLLGHSPHAPLDVHAAVDNLLRQLGVPGEHMPDRLDERLRMWRRELTGRRTLLILDNAADVDQIAAILPSEPGCLTILTSRRRLTELDGVTTVALDVLTTDDAIDLQRRIIGDRVLAAPQAAQEVARQCGHLPLAIRLASARLAHRPGWSLPDLAERLRGARNPLRELALPGRTVEAAFTLSYEQLKTDAQLLFRRLAGYPGQDFSTWTAAALADLDVVDADRVLTELVNVHLIEELSPQRFRIHDLLREYVKSLAADDPVADSSAAIGRLLDVCLHTADAAARLLNYQLGIPADYNLGPPPRYARPLADQSAAVAWFAAERANLIAVIELAAEERRHRHTWRLAHATWRDLCNHGYQEASLRAHELAIEAAERAGEPHGVALSHNNIAYIFHRQGRWDDALQHLDRATAIQAEIGNWTRVVGALANKANVLQFLGRRAEAIDVNREALGVIREHPEIDRSAGLIVHADLGHAYIIVGDYALAERQLQRHLALADAVDSDVHRNISLVSFGELRLRQGRFAEAIALCTEALRMGLIGTVEPRARAHLTLLLGTAYRGLGQLHDALRCHHEALAIAEDNGVPSREFAARVELAATLLALADHAGARDEYQRALKIARELDLDHLIAEAADALAALARAGSAPPSQDSGALL